MSTRRLIDLSHTIESGMITYRGLPAPMICDFLSPFHRLADGADLSELELESLADLPGGLVRVITPPAVRLLDPPASPAPPAPDSRPALLRES